jgi:hypothetical protein
MEFYYQGVLRWAYGFENPNKAAALIASLLPFCWLLFFSRKAWRSWLGLALFLGGWFLLVKTYSRGGVVAAVVSQGYMAWHFRRQVVTHWRKAALIVAALMVMFTISGLGTRHMESVGDASVHNRFALWKGGLTMLADTPSGVGAGNSGQMYMDWYQPLTAKEGYRTMVNSYLTFAVEQGLWVFAGISVLFGVFWLVTGNLSSGTNEIRRLTIAVSQGSLLAFLAAGFFSTTMESPVLWFPPLVATVVLAAVFLRDEKNWSLILKRTLAGIGAALLVTGLIYLSGRYLRSQGDIGRKFSFKNRELVSAQLWQKQSFNTVRMSVWVDREVLGREYGKPLREILEKGLAMELSVFDLADGRESRSDVLVYCGERCVLPAVSGRQRVIFIMPPLETLEKLDMDSVAACRLKVVVPGRILERSSNKVLKKLDGRMLALGGADKNVLWYWNEILDSGILE